MGVKLPESSCLRQAFLRLTNLPKTFLTCKIISEPTQEGEGLQLSVALSERPRSSVSYSDLTVCDVYERRYLGFRTGVLEEVDFAEVVGHSHHPLIVGAAQGVDVGAV